MTFVELPSRFGPLYVAADSVSVVCAKRSIDEDRPGFCYLFAGGSCHEIAASVSDVMGALEAALTPAGPAPVAPAAPDTPSA